MTLRKKLVVAFFGMLVLPILLVCILGFTTIEIQMHAMNKEYDSHYTFLGVLRQPLQIMYQITDEPFSELQKEAEERPVSLQDTDYLDEVNAVLEDRYSYLVVYRNDSLFYDGDGKDFPDRSDGILSAINASGDGGCAYIDSDDPILAKHFGFTFQDGAEGICIIVTKVSPILGKIGTSLVVLIVITVIALAITATIMVTWLVKSVLDPIETLSKASREMGAGNLEYKVERKSKDEIGQLCDDFEEMRRHLKTQIDAKEQYEIDSREMISNISHDLKTPITAIKGYAEGMLDGVAETPERQQKYLKTIVTRANDMTSLVDELSYYSKLDTNKLPYKFETVPVNGYFADCVAENELDLEMKDFEISFQSEVAGDVKVVMDCEQIRRVMNNLIGNAVKYRNEDIHGVLAVKLTDADDSVRISVIDNGIGISKEALPHIFDRFYRADKSRTAGRAGTGLGLAIVKKIVVEHGGRVFARSEIGKGTTISFTVKKGA